MAWKATHSKNGTDDKAFRTNGWRYWIIFCHRNMDAISSTKAVQFDSKRDDWCCLEKIQDMYDDVYDR
jgi:hypothetical protein